jgi:hypothetical protein
VNILVLNQDWLVEEWREAGHKVLTCGLADHLDIVLPTAHVHIDQALLMAKEPFSPDIIVIHDNSGPIVVAGLEETEIPVVFYSVDTHHHHSIHKYLAHLFDYSFVAQKDYIPLFEEVGIKAEWLPLWASRYIENSNDKKHGAVFVGNLNPQLNPNRIWFFDEINKITKVSTQIGKFWEIFPFSEIVVNQTVKGDLNFRVFEAMMSGAMLLTENTQNGLHELFKEGIHLATYIQANPHDAAEKIEYYLSNIKLCREIGSAGREEILKNHTPAVRAERFLQVFKDLKKKDGNLKYLSAAANYCDLGFRAEKLDTGVATKSYISAMRCLDIAFSKNEPIDTQLACYAICTFLKYDHFLKLGSGNEMLHRAREIYPHEPILKIAHIRHYLNLGNFSQAKVLAGEISTSPVDVTYAKSEELIRMILDGHSFGL